MPFSIIHFIWSYYYLSSRISRCDCFFFLFGECFFFIGSRIYSHVSLPYASVLFFHIAVGSSRLPLSRLHTAEVDYPLYSAIVDGVWAFAVCLAVCWCLFSVCAGFFALSLLSFFTLFRWTFFLFSFKCVYSHLKYFIGSWLLPLHLASMANTVNQTCRQRALKSFNRNQNENKPIIWRRWKKTATN